MEQEQKVDVWASFNKAVQQYPEIAQIAWDYREASQHLKRIRPIYEKMYRHWLCGLFFPYDPYIEGQFLIRCSCGKLLWKDDPKSVSRHLRHQQRYATNISLVEFVKLKLGLI